MAEKFILWKDGIRRDKQPATDGCIELPPNSISFVQTDVFFRLPNYIAMRFNLQIAHVHRGILLGTGPLVDPGFEGRLLIPLHNLTSSAYRVSVNDALIWVEFTKTTFGLKDIDPGFDEACSDDWLFPARKKRLSAVDYLIRANDGNPIESSIPIVIAKSEQAARDSAADAELARNSAVKAEGSAKTARNWLIGAGVVGGLSVFIGVLAIYFQAIGIVQDASSVVRSAEDKVSALAKNNTSERHDLSVPQIETTSEAGAPTVANASHNSR